MQQQKVLKTRKDLNMPIDFCPLASGSSGNCIYFAAENSNILIDAGLSGIRIERALSSIGVHPTQLDAIFITHEHGDHIMGAGIMSRRFGIPLFATAGTWESAEKDGSLGKILPKNKNVIYENEGFTFRDLYINPFTIPHDAWNPVGYSIFARSFKVTVATDIGHMNDGIKQNIAESDVLLIESNHDVDMLINGRYPYPLKQRILGDKGHLSNVACGAALTEIAGAKLKHVYLGHLSEENNRPELAYETVSDILTANNIDLVNGVNLHLADRYRASRFLRLE